MPHTGLNNPPAQGNILKPDSPNDWRELGSQVNRPNQINESQHGDAALIQLIEATEPDAEFVSLVSEILRKFDVSDEFFHIGVSNERVGNLFAAIIGSLIKVGHQFEIQPEDVMENWDYIEGHANFISANKFLDSIDDRGGLLSFVTSQPFTLNRLKFYRETIKVFSMEHRTYWRFIEEGVAGVASGEWQTALTATDGIHVELIELVKDLNAVDTDFRLKVPAKDAALAFIRSVLVGNYTITEEVRERFLVFLDFLQSGYKSSLLRDVTEDLMNLTDAGQSVRLIELMGGNISLNDEGNPERIVRRVFFPLVNVPSVRTSQWLCDIAQGKGEAFWSLPEEVKTELEARLRNTIGTDEQPDEMIITSLTVFANLLKIDLRRIEEEGAESQEDLPLDVEKPSGEGGA